MSWCFYSIVNSSTDRNECSLIHLHSSSRSQCIINVRCDLDNLDEDAAAQSCTAMLTIVDLAGAEREKRTGNQVQIVIGFSFSYST